MPKIEPNFRIDVAALTKDIVLTSKDPTVYKDVTQEALVAVAKHAAAKNFEELFVTDTDGERYSIMVAIVAKPKRRRLNCGRADRPDFTR